MSAIVEMALWLERNLDPRAPTADTFVAFRRAFPDSTVDQLKAALGLLTRTLEDRIEAVKAEAEAVRALVRRLRGEG